jgi:hypothetical protein
MGSLTGSGCLLGGVLFVSVERDDCLAWPRRQAVSAQRLILAGRELLRVL